jgi:hypothetical protein
VKGEPVGSPLKKQIPRGNDRKKNKGKGEDKEEADSQSG